MPARNTIKIDVPESYYHVYARGASKQPIFVDATDYEYFVGLFARYLSGERAVSKRGEVYPSYAERVELLAYCLMGNHFHLLLYQEPSGAMSQFMRSLMTSYSRYFNLRHRRTGSLFESRYKASRIDRQDYLEHISRYIHLNPRYWKNYPYSSLKFYAKAGSEPEWLRPERVLDMFETHKTYMDFVADYEDQRSMLEVIKHDLADT